MPHTRYSILLAPLMVFSELLLLFVVLFYFINNQYIVDFGESKSLAFLIKSHYKAYLILSMFWYFIGSYFKNYNFDRSKTLAAYLQNTFLQLIIFSIVLFAISGIKSSDLLNVDNSILFMLTFSTGIYIMRIVLFLFLKWLRILGANSRNILFVDQNSNTKKFVQLFNERKDLAYKIKGIINGTEMDGLGIKNFNIQDFERILDKFRINVVYLSLEGELTPKEISNIKLLANKKRVQVNFIPSESLMGYNDLNLNYLYTYPIFTQISNPLDNLFNRILKRTIDILLSSIGLLILSITLFPFVAVFIIIETGFPVFFTQKRKGIDDKVFNCYKFRTMKVNPDHDKKITTKGDVRITKIGRILRTTSLDELPQLYNVLKGDMSLVGPRPHMLRQDEEYDEIIKYYSLRHHVKPGITGLAQISGHRGEINSEKDMDDRVRADIYYIKNWTFFLDLIIIFKTFINMVKGDENAI